MSADLDIRIFDLTQLSEAASAIATGLPEQFSGDRIEELVLRTKSANSQPSKYFVAFDQGEVVGLVAYMSHELTCHGGILSGYQAAGVFTSRKHRGKGIFTAIARAAEDELRSRGVALIFGFPNSNAYPIWVHKLGYRKIGLQKWRALCFPLLARATLRKGSFCDGAIMQSDDEIIAMKKPLYGDQLVIEKRGGGILWGIRRDYQKAGMKMGLLDIGGARFQTYEHLVSLYNAALKKSGSPVAVRFVASAGNPLTTFFRGVQDVRSEYQCLILRNLNGDADRLRIGLFGGIHDAF